MIPSLPESRLLYHGSLALRNQASREALSVLKQHHSDSVFMDVNLRDPWWQKKFVLELADDADWVKLNEDELTRLGAGAGDCQAQAREFLSTHNLKGLIVTLGAKGAIAFTDDGGCAEIAPVRTPKRR